MFKVSIIIPCYNQGIYLYEALDDFESDNKEYEIIIVNDGSTEMRTLNGLEDLKKKGFRIISQQNAGLAAARNTGITASQGKYIMLLDADNIVESTFIKKATTIFDNQLDISVIYSDAVYFGAKTGEWKVGNFNLQKLMIENYIDACAMVRKSVFFELGGYDEAMKDIKSGWEDWEMWLRIAFSGKKFFYIPETGFRYRVTDNSMIEGIKNSYEIRNRLTEYLHQKYPVQLGHQYIAAYVIKRFKPHPFKFILKLSMLTWFNKNYQKLLRQNKIIRGI